MRTAKEIAEQIGILLSHYVEQEAIAWLHENEITANHFNLELIYLITKARAEMQEKCAKEAESMCHEPSEGKLIGEAIRAIPNE